MKNKRKVSLKIAIGIISLVILIMVCLSPNLIGRLLGNVNSIDTSSSQGVNTGVVLNLNKVYDYENNNPIKMKIYNGSSNKITINGIISRYICTNNCADFTYTALDEPIIVKSDEEKEYVIKNSDFLVDNTALIQVGIQYDMLIDEDEVTKTYNIVSSSFYEGLDFGDLNSTNFIVGDGDDSKEFVIASSKSTDGKDNVHIKLSDANIHMDKSEDLDDLNIYYSIKSGFGNKWFYDHPQTTDATGNSSNGEKKMFGETNKSNYKNIFTYTDSNERITGSGAFEYSNQFKLYGSPNDIYSNKNVILGFFFEQYKDSKFGGYEYWSDETAPFSSSEIPYFTLTVYDKSNLKAAILNAYEKLNKQDEEVETESWNEYLNIFANASFLYASRDKYISYLNLNDSIVGENGTYKEVTQTEIDNMVNILNNTEITVRSSADYTTYNELLNKIDNIKENWYPAGSYSEFKIVYDERTNYEGLSNSYQVKVDNYVARLQDAFDTLNSNMLEADYTEFSEIYDKVSKYIPSYYVDFSDMQKAIDEANSLSKNLKRDEQEKVKAVTEKLKDADKKLVMKDAEIEVLESALAKTKNIINEIIINGVAYELYIKESWEEYQTALENAKTALSCKIDEQEKVNAAAKNLNSAIEKLKDNKMKALGYSDSDDYHPFVGSLSIEGYVKYLKELNESLYAEETLTLVNNVLLKFENNKDGIMDITIDMQDKMDSLLEELEDIINNQLEKKIGNYTKLCNYYTEALELNLNYYENVSNLRQILWNINWDYKIDEQSLIDTKAEELRKALDALVMKDADYTEFDKAYINAKNVNSSYYANYSIIEKAISQANSVKGLKIDKQSVVDKVTSALNNALDGLVLKDADYSKINSLKVKIEQLDESKYTNFEIVNNALNTIVYGKKITEQDKVDGMYSELKSAYDNLIKVRANYSELSLILSRIPSDYSSYDNDLQNEIKTILEEVKKLPNNLKYDEQSKIDYLVDNVKKIIDKLPVINNEESSNDVVLSYLKVNDEKVDISSVPFKYVVEYSVVEAKITVGLASSNSTYKVYGGNVLIPGDNNVTIVVNTNDGKTYTYTLVITRKTTSDYLSDLSVKESNIDFNKNKQEYTIKIDKNTNKLDLSAITEDENAKVTIKGNKNLKNGSKVEIKVESADGSVRVYTLNVQKAGSVDVRVVIILIMVLAILAGVFKFIQVKKKIKEENNAY